MANFEERKIKRIIGSIGLLLALILIIADILLPKKFLISHSKLYPVAVASGAIFSGVLLAEAFGIAPAVFEVLLGFIIGLTGVKGSEALEVLGLMGSASLMFFAGLEIDLESLSKTFKRSLVMGTLSFVVPLMATTTLLLLIGYTLKISLIIASGVSTTGVAVVYSILRKMNVLKNEAGQSLLAATMVTDILCIVTFSILMMNINYILLIYILSIIVIPPALSKAFKKMPELAHEAEVKLIITILLAVILFSEVVGIHAVLYSFILGLAFSGMGSLKKEALRKLEGIVFGFLAPMFFTSAGIEMASGNPTSYIYMMLILLGISYPAKILINYTVLRLFCKNITKGLFRLSNIFAARLTMSTIIAYAGLTSGFLSPDVSGGIMLSAIIATLISGLIVGKNVLAEEEL